MKIDLANYGILPWWVLDSCADYKENEGAEADSRFKEISDTAKEEIEKFFKAQKKKVYILQEPSSDLESANYLYLGEVFRFAKHSGARIITWCEDTEEVQQFYLEQKNAQEKQGFEHSTNPFNVFHVAGNELRIVPSKA